MKRLLFLLLLIPSLAFGAGNNFNSIEDPAYVNGIANAAIASINGATFTQAASFCDCSGAVNWCWEVTANDTTITNSGGCADAGWDTTGTATGSPTIVAAPAGKTGYAVRSDTDGELYSFDLPSGLADVFTIQFDIRAAAFEDGSIFVQLLGNGTVDYARVFYNLAADDIRISWLADSAGDVATTTLGLAEDTWYTVTAKLRGASTDPSLYVDVDGGSSGSNNANLSAWVADSNTLRIGGGATAGDHYIKNIKIWNSWQ